ncbi:MAG: methyltransferase [Rhizomicrobium sp.]
MTRGFRATKSYDVLAALPLVAWFGYTLWRQGPALRFDFGRLLAGADAVSALQFLSVAGSAAFFLVVIVALLVRVKPVARSAGVLPRLTAFAGTFLSVAILRLALAPLPLALQMLSNALIFGGAAASAWIVWRLGRSFAIMPEARELVTNGPYAFARHPLYTAEALIVIGTALQFAQPWAGLLAAANVALLYARSVFEERVLEAAYPAYAAYRARTARFIPGVF